ncbi:MAG: HD domain-containing protein [Gallionella sp.]|nr:HD domain-containing protein [Gallionella sp.]
MKVTESLRYFRDDLTFRIDENNLSVRAEQLRTRMRLLPSTAVSTMLVEVFFVWTMWSRTSQHALLIWLTCLILLHLASLVGLSAYQNIGNTVATCKAFSRRLVTFAAAVGLMWGIGILFLYPGDLLSQFFVICVMLGLSAGATVLNPTHLPSLFVFVLGMMIPLSFRVMVEPNELHWALSFMMLMFVGAMLLSGQFINRLLFLSLVQRFENQSLTDRLAQLNNELEHKVEDRTAQLQHKTDEVGLVRDVTIVAMATLAEARDNETGNHLMRTQTYIRTVANKLREHPRFKHFLTEENIGALYKLSPLHDIGKIGIPDHILLKKGKLTVEEFEIMKRHATLGGDALAAAESNLPVPSRFLHIGREIAAGHHEKWDGSGYPAGLKGDDIPISARLMAIVDVYDALISKRTYKEPYSHEAAVAHIRNGRGRHFDPDVTDAFLEIQDEFEQIAKRFHD